MDPAFAVEFNDVDLCLRVREHGYEILWTPEAQLIHMESMTRGRPADAGAKARNGREAQLLRNRWKAWIESDPYFNPNLSLQSPLRIPAFPPRVRLPWLA
jgi:GT2 family glycosyltransferase